MAEEDNIFTLCSFYLRLLDILMHALPSKVDTQAYQNQNMRQLNQKLLLLEQEMKAEMLKGKRQNEEPSEDAMGKKNSYGETQEPSKGANGHSYEETQLHDANETRNDGSLENARCKLLNWDGTKVVVAEGTIASTDFEALAHHMPLGPGCWKVWVNPVIVNAPLFRPNREMSVLEDAIGSTLAWPTHVLGLTSMDSF